MNDFLAFGKYSLSKTAASFALPDGARGPSKPKEPQQKRRGELSPELSLFGAEKLNALGLRGIAEKLRVFWNSRMRSTAGLAYPQSHHIVLNPKLTEFGDAEVERTLLHELAHLVAHHRYGRRRIAPHGPEWRKACEDLGLFNEARCHDLPLPRRRMSRQFVYECPQCRTRLERVRAFRRAAACMLCCRRHSAGRYDDRFRLTRVKTEIAAADGAA